MHIEDLCNAIFLVIKNHVHKSKNKIFNVSQNILLERIVQEIRNKYNTKIFIPFSVNEYFVRMIVNFFSKFLNYQLQIRLYQAL